MPSTSRQPASPIRRNIGWIIGLICGGLLVRVIFLFLFFDRLAEDPDAYRKIAENIANHHVYGLSFGEFAPVQPTAYRPPLYPVLLSQWVFAGTLSQYAVAGLHLVLGIATLVFAFLFARRVGLSRLGCAAVAALVAVDPIALNQSALVMTETAAIFLGTVALWSTSRLFVPNARSRDFVISGTVIGLAALCRPTFLIWGGLIVAAFGFRFLTAKIAGHSVRQPAAAFGKAILMGLFVGVMLLPWIVRNQLVFGKPIFATSHGGYTIYLGNNDSFYDYLASGNFEPWNGEAELRPIVLKIRAASRNEDFTIDEVQKDRQYYQLALETIRRRPVDFAWASLIRVARFWAILPNFQRAQAEQASTSTLVLRWGTAIYYGTLFLLVGLSILPIAKSLADARSDRKNAAESRQTANTSFTTLLLPGFLMSVAFQGLHILYWSNMRMRAPLVAWLAVLAVLGFSYVLRYRAAETSVSH